MVLAHPPEAETELAVLIHAYSMSGSGEGLFFFRNSSSA
jgi:hypothetical protein